MATYTTRLRLGKTVKGEALDTWATNYGALADRIDESIAGVTTLALTTNYTLTTTSADPGTTDEARKAIIYISSSDGAYSVTLPNVEKLYDVRNASRYTITFTTGSGTTCTVGGHSRARIYCGGSNVCTNLGYLSRGWLKLAQHTIAAGVQTITYLDGTTANAGTVTSVTVDLANPGYSQFRIFATAIKQSSGSGKTMDITVGNGTSSAAVTTAALTSATSYGTFIEVGSVADATSLASVTTNPVRLDYAMASGGGPFTSLTGGIYSALGVVDRVVLTLQSSTSFDNGLALMVAGRA